MKNFKTTKNKIKTNFFLWLKKVMQRIVKRFLLHKQRESDEVGEADFDELKQDLQMVRYEMLNDLKRTREESYRMIAHINSGLLIIGEEMFKESNSENSNRFKDYKNSDLDLNFNHENPIESKGSFIPIKDDTGFRNLKDAPISLNKLSSWVSIEKKIGSSIESLGSSTDTQSSTEQNTEMLLINSSPNSEIDGTNNLNSLPVIDLLDNQKLKGLSLNELHVINEEDELSSESSIEKSRYDPNDQITINIVEHVDLDKGIRPICNEDDKEFLF